jgi:hypothetical protein
MLVDEQYEKKSQANGKAQKVQSTDGSTPSRPHDHLPKSGASSLIESGKAIAANAEPEKPAGSPAVASSSSTKKKKNSKSKKKESPAASKVNTKKEDPEDFEKVLGG